jgi:hypothetical protein
LAVPPTPMVGLLVDSLVFDGDAADAGPMLPSVDAATTLAASRASRRRLAWKLELTIFPSNSAQACAQATHPPTPTSGAAANPRWPMS